MGNKGWTIRRGAVVFALAVTVACQSPREQTGRPQTTFVEPTFRIEGKVFKADSEDHSGVLVFCAGRSYSAYTDEGGDFVMTGLPPGTYRLRAQAPDYIPTLIETVSLAEGVADPSKPYELPDVTLQEELTPSQQAERILCSVMGQVLLEGEPTAEGVVVRAVGTDFLTVTNAEGHYQLLRMDPGQYQLAFEKEGFKSQRHTVRLEKGDLIFPDPIVLERITPIEEERILNGSVTLLDRQGNPVLDYSDVLVYLEGANRMTLPDEDGMFQFLGLDPVTYVVAAAGPAYMSRDRVQVDLTDATMATVALTLQSLEEPTSAPGTLIGQVFKDDRQDPLMGTLVGLVELGMTAMTDATGAYQFTNVPPGTYSLVAQADGYYPAGLEEVVVQEESVSEAIEMMLEKQRDYPQVIATDPADGDSNVLIREIVPMTVRFSKEMNPESVRGSFSISPDVSLNLYVGKEHELSDFQQIYVEMAGYGGPRPLQYNRWYTVTIDRAAVDAEGLSMEQPYRFRFRTGQAAIIDTYPHDGATGVYADPARYRPVVYFNAPIDPRSVSPDLIQVRPSLGSNVQVDVVDNQSTGWSMMQLMGQWRAGTRYSVTIRGGIRTVNNSLVSNVPYTFRFTTDPGQQLNITPGRGPGRR